MIKVLYLDLGGNEDYSLKPQKYGGIRAVGAQLKQYLPYFYILGQKECFENFTRDDRWENCITATPTQIKKIREGAPLKDVIDDADKYHLVFHTSTNIHVNLDGLRARQVVWVPGQNETIHPKNKILLLHSEFQNPQYSSPVDIFPIVLGVPDVAPSTYVRGGALFQCTNHYPQIGSSILADWCNKNKIYCYFAGPIAEGYDLLDHIDGFYTKYLGEISQDEKEAHLKSAAAFVSFYRFYLNSDSLAIKEALSFGCPVITSAGGNPHGTIINGENGFLVNSEFGFVAAVNDLLNINPQKCRESVEKYSCKKMVESFDNVFKFIVQNESVGL